MARDEAPMPDARSPLVASAAVRVEHVVRVSTKGDHVPDDVDDYPEQTLLV